MICLPFIRRLCSRFVLLTAAIVLVLAPTSCRKTPGTDGDGGVYINLSLQLAPEVKPGVDVDLSANPEFRAKVEAQLPELLRACFYDVESHLLVSEEFLSPNGDYTDLVPGVYDVLVYNMDTEASLVEDSAIRGGTYAHTSRTGIGIRLEEGGEDGIWENQPIVYEPDHLFVGRIAGVMIGQTEDVQTLECELTRLSETWSVEFTDVEGAERIAEAVLYVTGQAEGRYLWDRRARNQTCALRLDCAVDVPKRQIYTVLNTFGLSTEAGADVLVNLMLTLRDGTRARYIFDVTDQWQNTDNTAHRIVISKPVDIPAAGSSDGGMDPVVTDWDGEEFDIQIG